MAEDSPILAGGERDGAPSFDLVAASLRSTAADLSTFVEVLADRLEQALPGGVKVERSRTRAFSRARRVSRIEVALGDERYLLSAAGGTIDPRRAKAVRGVVLKTESRPLDVWIDELAQGLAAEAERSDESRFALGRMLED